MRVPILRRTSSHPGLSPAIRRVGAVWASVLLAALLGGAVAGCTGTAPSAAGWTQDPAAAAASVSTGGMTMSGPMGGMHTADQAATAWSARPDFVKAADARTVEAYAYALARGDALEWMP